MKQLKWIPDYEKCDYKGYSLAAFLKSYSVRKYDNAAGKATLCAAGSADNMQDAKQKAIAYVDGVA